MAENLARLRKTCIQDERESQISTIDNGPLKRLKNSQQLLGRKYDFIGFLMEREIIRTNHA